MDKFPRDVALERQHRDIARLIEEYSHGPASGTELAIAAATGVSPGTGSSSKSRPRKSSHRKQSVRSVADDGIRQSPAESDPRPKKAKRPRVPASAQAQQSARLMDLLSPIEPQLFSVEQPPSYENAINGRRAQLAAMQRAAAVGVDGQSIYHTGLPFEEPPQHHQCAGNMIGSDLVGGFHPPQTGVVLRPRAYLPPVGGGLVEAELSSQTVHNSPTVPICQAYSPPGVHGPEAQHLQLLQQRGQIHPSQNPHHHHHRQNSRHHPPSDAYVSVPQGSAQPTPSSGVFQYPTPPSHHTETTSPPLLPATGGTTHPNYPTPPSHEETSPGQWSSSSSKSPKSDWSTQNRSPSHPRAVTNTAEQHGIKDEPVTPAYV